MEMRLAMAGSPQQVSDELYQIKWGLWSWDNPEPKGEK